MTRAPTAATHASRFRSERARASCPWTCPCVAMVGDGTSAVINRCLAGQGWRPSNALPPTLITKRSVARAMVKLNPFPEEGELVVGTVREVQNFGAFVTLEEYPGKE